VNKLKIPGLPTLPTLPTLAELRAMLISLIPPPIKNLIGLDLNALMAQVIGMLPGFDLAFFLPIPFVFSFNIPELDFNEMLVNLYTSLVLQPMEKLYQFCINTLSKFLSFSFPTFCITL
jgi:hypothetical protein